MSVFTVIWCVAAMLVLFGLVEGMMLWALMSSVILGMACGARLPREDRAPHRTVGPRLATVGIFLGHAWVGVMTPYAALALLSPRSDWLAGLTMCMTAASAGFGVAALAAGFLAGLLASEVSLPITRHESALLKREPAREWPCSSPREAA